MIIANLFLMQFLHSETFGPNSVQIAIKGDFVRHPFLSGGRKISNGHVTFNTTKPSS